MNKFFSRTWMMLLIIWTCMLYQMEALTRAGETGLNRDSTKAVEWKMAQILEGTSQSWIIVGNPTMIDCSYGKAVHFDGYKDAFVLDTNILGGLLQFTVEVIMRPDTNGQREQRFLHFGEIRGERVMVEMRVPTNDQWYLDTYMKSGQTGQTLVDSTKLHPLNQWYHVAFIVDQGKMEAYVNGNKELEGQIPFTPFSAGQTSIGVRLNRVNWFKGSMYKLKITPRILQPSDFMKL
jgi:hypothetical protein